METSYQNPVLAVAQENEFEQAAFIRKTYMHVALAVLAFVLIETLFLKVEFLYNLAFSMTQGWTWLIVLGLFMFGTNYIQAWASRTQDVQQQYIALTLYVAIYALVFMPLIAFGIMIAGMAIISQAAIMTLFLFSGLTAVVFISGKDFSFMRNILTVGGFLALGLIVTSIIFGFNLGLWFSFGMVVLAGGSILYQTSNIIHHYHKSQHVAAALGLFSSLMLLFYYILQILISLSGD